MASGFYRRLSQKYNFGAPWLMFPGKFEDDEEVVEDEREISSVTLGLDRTMKIFLPEVSKKVYVSCKDWLLVTPQGDIDVFLLHPLTRVQIHLPKLTTLQHYHPFESLRSHFVDKAVLSANPSTTSDFIVMIICGSGRRLAFWRSGDTSWTSIDFWKPCQFLDITYSNNKLYGLDKRRRIICCDVNGSNPTQLVQVFDNLSFIRSDEKSYLVELPGPGEKFLVIHRNKEESDDEDIDYDHYVFISNPTLGFNVYEVNIEDGSWVEVKSLGNKSVFLGYNSSFILECNEINKCKPNCIYFTEDHLENYIGWEKDDGGGDDRLIGVSKDMGIYHMSDGTILPILDDRPPSGITPPTWIAPSSF